MHVRNNMELIRFRDKSIIYYETFNYVMEKVLILSDIHGNLSALNRIFEYEQMELISGLILLGDLIDYGPRSNEVISKIKQIADNMILVNIWGNHELAIMTNDGSRFSSNRGRVCAEYTKKNLSDESINFLNHNMEKAGKKEFILEGKKCLAVHGSLVDYYWKSISHEESDPRYSDYDIVFSGHSHIPHYFEHFYESDNEMYRNRKKTIFINPGSVGQPRNHNCNAHYAIWEPDSMTVQIKTIAYSIETEMSFFSEEVDSFYKERLKIGI